jgi:hypothetical protein
LSVFVLDKRKRPVMPCCEKRARPLLECGRAVVHRRYRFTIRLKDRVDVEPVRVKLDPGSRTTGIAVVADEDGNKPARFSACLSLLTGDGRSAKLLAAHSAVAAQTFATAHRGSITEESRKAGLRRAFNTGSIPAFPGASGCIAWRRFQRYPSNAFDSRLFESGNADGINAKYCKLLHRADGYCYARQPALPPRREERGFQRGRL